MQCLKRVLTDGLHFMPVAFIPKTSEKQIIWVLGELEAEDRITDHCEGIVVIPREAKGSSKYLCRATHYIRARFSFTYRRLSRESLLFSSLKLNKWTECCTIN